MLNDIATHVPKGGMCATCVNALNDCSALPFSTYTVIGKNGNSKIVKCLEWISKK
jgi:hypothetical protein